MENYLASLPNNFNTIFQLFNKHRQKLLQNLINAVVIYLRKYDDFAHNRYTLILISHHCSFPIGQFLINNFVEVRKLAISIQYFQIYNLVLSRMPRLPSFI